MDGWYVFVLPVVQYHRFGTKMLKRFLDIGRNELVIKSSERLGQAMYRHL